jgi:hypothetical protein
MGELTEAERRELISLRALRSAAAEIREKWMSRVQDYDDQIAELEQNAADRPPNPGHPVIY